jgi:hypothetical protein
MAGQRRASDLWLGCWFQAPVGDFILRFVPGLGYRQQGVELCMRVQGCSQFALDFGKVSSSRANEEAHDYPLGREFGFCIRNKHAWCHHDTCWLNTWRAISPFACP